MKCNKCAEEQVFAAGESQDRQRICPPDDAALLSVDWHRADVIAALHKSGITLSELGRRHRLAASTLANALIRPWPKGEAIIAAYLKVEPSVIWPSRYRISRNR